MKTLLFIGLEFHNKTKSSQFLKDLLKTKYAITDCTENEIDNFEGQFFDVVLIWQVRPIIKTIIKKISYTHIAFFPMYDCIPSKNSFEWCDYNNVNIINFSKALHDYLIKRGFSSYYIQYFPKPLTFNSLGDENSIFFWQRKNDITIKTVEKIFNCNHVQHAHFHQAIDPHCTLVLPSEQWNSKISYSTWYEKKEDLQKDIERYALYIAPRKYEGIGMSFLDAMAIGRCVIAPNYATMNEYIEHNKTGILYDLENPEVITIKDVRAIQEQTIKFIKEGYKKWESDKYNILNWIVKEPNMDMKKFQIYKLKLFLTSILPYFFYKSVTPTVVRIKIFHIQTLKIYKDTEYLRVKLFGILIFKKKLH